VTAGPPALAGHPDVRAGLDLLAAWIEAQLASAGVPGLSVGVVHDQELVWARGFGWASLEARMPASPETLYRIASITKLFTATAILQLRDAGKLGLDDRLVRHLPWFAVTSRHAESPPITIRHLLTHTSGLPREAAFPYWTDGEFPTLEAIRARLPGQQAVLPTETRWKYSNLALTLAGEVVTAASGQPYPEYVRQRILEPLGMRDTHVTAPDPAHPRFATGYTRRLPREARRPAPYSDIGGLTAAGNMTTSVADLARFAMLQLRDGPAGGAQILSGATLREMQRPHWVEPDWEAGWGLGFRIVRQRGRTFVGHGGALNGYRSELRICPADRLAVIVLTNADDGNPVVYVEKAFEWLAPAFARAAAPAGDASEPDAGWQRYLGRYRNAWGDTQVLIAGGRLTLIGPFLPDPMLAPATLHPVAEHVFRLETKDGFGAHGEPVVFELDDGGRVARVRIGENYTFPVAEW
jgi:CubicO group peptidase (beta-lactamase class C family)